MAERGNIQCAVVPLPEGLKETRRLLLGVHWKGLLLHIALLVNLLTSMLFFYPEK
jgi:hypothetical protein